MWITRVSVNNPYFATVIMLAMLLLGLVAIQKIAVEEFPEVKYPVAVVTTIYKGASPEVVENDITKPMEEALNTLNGIKIIRSYSFENQSAVVAEFNLSVDPDKALQDVRDKVSAVSAGFKKEVDNPVISKFNSQDSPIMSITISSPDMKLRDLTDWINKVVKKKLQTVAGIGEVKVIGGVERQVRVNIDPFKLKALNLTVAQVLNSIQNANQNYPLGNIKSNYTNIGVRLSGKLKQIQDFKNIVITYRNNVPITLADVTEVVDGQDEFNSLTLINGEKAVGIDIRSIQNANVVEIANNIYKKLDELEAIKPKGVKIKINVDRSKKIEESLNNVEHTLIEGAALTLAIVFLFLKSWRSMMITSLTLPIALIGTIFVIYICNFTLNMMSLMALSLSIGLLIDDAIVVRENIVRHLHMGKSHYKAALDGTNEIGLAVLATTFTIVAVFLPVGFMQGLIGKFFYQFGITVTVAVLISLLVSFTLDPMLSSIWRERPSKTSIGLFFAKITDSFELYFDKLVLLYKKIINWSLNYKKTTLLIGLICLIGSFLLVPHIGGEFIPQADQGEYSISFKTKVGSSLDYTAVKIQTVEKLLKNNIPEINSISSWVNKNFGEDSNNATLKVDIGNKTKRKRTLNEILMQTRELLKEVGGIEVQNVIAEDGMNDGQKPINIDIQGDSILVLKSITKELKNQISHLKGVTDLQDSYQDANPAYNLKVNRELASSLGLSLNDIGDTLSVLFAGKVTGSWEDPISGENYSIVTRIAESERDIRLLNAISLPTNYKQNENSEVTQVPLSEIASLNYGFAPKELDHVNLQRKITITGNIEGKDYQKIFTQIDNIIKNYEFPSGYYVKQSGSNEDMQESFKYAVSALLIGVAFIYMILTAQFRSFVLPLVIMVALPLSFIGVFITLFTFGSTINMFSIIGIIMLMGLATKNGILLVDFINREIKRGIEMHDAIVNAGMVRLRPIIMTTCAMIFGMLPLALSNTQSAEVRKPMAYAIIGGMCTSTILTLIIVPVLYVYLSRFSQHISNFFNRE